MTIPFSTLQVGDRAIIEDAEISEHGRWRKLMTLGLTPGTSVTVTRVAPLGDPIEIRIRGFNLSLRRDETVGIRVTKL
ncbi:MAG: FeoA domain-containing protein [Hahellaceae bacterium]|nr:FeoA domain-containing protein [Hahellaceae bacterium]MCP5169794.1 FeoA domain-containing protein [Hahellaceae bacterium]